jgi:Rrf2 family protein
MLSKKTKYALKALVILAKRYDTGWPMRISQISIEENIPHKFLESILLEMRKQGILGSKLGVNGGYYLLKSPKDIKLSSIIRLTDGPIALSSCVSLNFYERCAECKDEVSCGVRDVLKDARDATLSILANTSLEDIVNRENKLKQSVKK